MDQEDRDHFKNLALASATLQPANPNKSEKDGESSRPDPVYCLEKAKAICGCYRRDEAHDPETFVSALALVLSEYSMDVIEYAADPRTGIARIYPMGIPQVGQIANYMEDLAIRRDRMAKHDPQLKPVKFVPPPVEQGQFTYKEFLEDCEKTGKKPRLRGRFE